MEYTKPLNLLTIAPELRTNILKLCLPLKTIMPSKDYSGGRFAWASPNSPIFRKDLTKNAHIIFVCQQLYCEARPILAARIRWDFEFIHPQRVSRPVRKFYFQYTRYISIRPEVVPKAVIACFQNLQELHFDGDHDAHTTDGFKRLPLDWNEEQRLVHRCVGEDKLISEVRSELLMRKRIRKLLDWPDRPFKITQFVRFERAEYPGVDNCNIYLVGGL